MAFFISFAGTGVAVMEQLIELVTSLSANWKGLAVVMLMIIGGFIGPLVYVVKRQLDHQMYEGKENRDLHRSEGEANRQIHKEVASMNAQAMSEMSRAVHQLDLTIRASRIPSAQSLSREM